MECRDVAVMGGVGMFVAGTAKDEDVVAADDHRGVMACAVSGWRGGDETCKCPIEQVWRVGKGETAAVMVNSIHLRMDEPEKFRLVIEGQMEFHVASGDMDEKPFHTSGGFESADGEGTVWIFRSFQDGTDIGMACIGAHQHGDSMAVFVSEWSRCRTDDVRFQNTAGGDRRMVESRWPDIDSDGIR